MPSVNPGPATTITPSQLAVMTPQNALGPTVPGQGGNAYRLLGVARNISLIATGDTAIMPIINSSNWAPALMVTSNGQLAGVAGSVATAALGIFTLAAAGGSAIKANAALTNNSAANSAIAVATTIVNLSYQLTQVYVNVGTALATATVDIFLYGYDLS
jgi:hypothetical protein